MSRTDALLLIAVNLLWGSTYVVARGVLDTAPPLVLAFVRFALAAAWMCAAGFHRDRTAGQPSPTPSARWALAAVGVVGFGLAKLLNYEGLARSTATDAALIVNLEAIFTAAFAGVLLGQRLSAVQWAGVWVAFVGGVTLVWPQDAAMSGRALGNGLLVLSVAAEAVASVVGVQAMRRYSGPQLTAYATYWGTAVLAPLAFWQWRAAGFGTTWATPANGLGVLYLALVATVFAYVLWFRVLDRVDAGRVATYLYVQPLVGVSLGILLRGEWPTPLGLAGSVLVILGIVLSSRPAPEPVERKSG